MIYLGIDPGKKGSMTMLKDGKPKIYPMPETEAGIALMLSLTQLQEVIASGMPVLPKVKALIEAQHAFPGMGAKNQWTFAQHYGFLRGVLVSLSIPFTEVSPQKWMAYFGLKRKKGENTKQGKTRILQYAQNLFPDSNVNLQTADSLMLAEYLRRTDNNESKTT